MNELFNYGLLCFTSYITLLNPLGVLPVFLTMTANLDKPERNQTARKALLVSFVTMLAFALTGQLLFQFFGISVNAFRMVGGVIFFSMGQDMLQARLATYKLPTKADVKAYVDDISVTPLGIPMICGPGAITNSIVLMEDANTNAKKATLIGMMALVCLIFYVVLYSGGFIKRALGETGNKVLTRIMGLIVMVIAVEFFISGLRPTLQDIFQITP